MPEEGKFLKGLAVLDDIAYFGITTWAERSVRDSPDNHGELGAFDLINNKLLWRRTVRIASSLACCEPLQMTFAAPLIGSQTRSL